MKTWQLQEAKNKFSRLVEEARNGEPQIVTKNGKAVVVIASIEFFQKNSGRRIGDRKGVFLSRPHKSLRLETPRSREIARDIEL